MNRVAAFALGRKNSILSMSEKMFCPPQPLRLVWITPACAGKRIKLRKRHSICGDHPRVCGEKRGFHLNTLASTGSPPRVRGKEKGRRDGCDHQRITPAYAGKSSHFLLRKRSKWDHPRVCGEKITDETIGVVIQGSPPRVRGKVSVLLVDVVMLRVTPAYAGKRLWETPLLCRNGDHPRVCGEKFNLKEMSKTLLGSPPRMRGKDVRQELQHSGRGITPACAGKSKNVA